MTVAQQWKTYIAWENEGIRSSNWYELNAAKFSVVSLALLLAKVWRPMLAPHAGWFAAAFVALGAYPAARAVRSIERFRPQDR